jgi:hypothetical protein
MTQPSPIPSIDESLKRLRVSGRDIHFGEPDSDPERRISAIRPHFGRISWSLPPSYRELLAIAGELSALDADHRGIHLYALDEMVDANADLVHMPEGVSRGDGKQLSTNHLIGFASATYEAVWCFDITSPNAEGEYPIHYHHPDEPCARLLETGEWEKPCTPAFPTFRHWLAALVDALSSEKKPAWWAELGTPSFAL